MISRRKSFSYFYWVFILLLWWAALPAQDFCKITYISNEGFLLETHGKKMLIDGLFEPIGGTL